MNSIRIDSIFYLYNETMEDFEPILNDIGSMVHKDVLCEKDKALLKAIMLNQYKIKELSPAGHEYYRSVAIDSDIEICLSLLEEILTNTWGWRFITRKQAKSCITNIRQRYFLIKQGIQILENRQKNCIEPKLN
ncbi:MAG: hypothetical protein E6Q62_09280 [Nitrosomonas sp.]|nr:MAG: hypothetical protein E6Q62_09280 [Nitrosomonas sp.]